MIVELECVVPDGTDLTDVQVWPYVQHLDGETETTKLDGSTIVLPAIPSNTDVTFNLRFYGQNKVAFPMTDYEATLTSRRSASSADPVFSNAATIDGVITNLMTCLVSRDQTEDEGSRTNVYGVLIRNTSTDRADSVLPESHMEMNRVPTDPDEVVTVAGPDMLLAGLPVVTSADLGKVVVPTDDDPVTLAWTSSPFEVVTGNAAIDAGALIKASSTEARYETLGAADAATLLSGVAKTACSGAAASFQGYFISGLVTPMLSDGTGTIAAGASVEPSTTVAGRVKSGSTNSIGFNVGAAVAATLNAAVSVR